MRIENPNLYYSDPRHLERALINFVFTTSRQNQAVFIFGESFLFLATDTENKFLKIHFNKWEFHNAF